MTSDQPRARLTEADRKAHELRAAIERELPGAAFEQVHDERLLTTTFRATVKLEQTVGMTDEAALRPGAEERVAHELRRMIDRLRQSTIDATGLQPIIDAQVREAAQRHERLVAKLAAKLESIERELRLGDEVVPVGERDWMRAQRSLLQSIIAGEGR